MRTKKGRIYYFFLLFFIINLSCSNSTNTDSDQSRAGLTPTSALLSVPTIVSTSTLTPTITPSPLPTYMLALGVDSNLRSGPGLNFRVTQVARKGSTLPVYGRDSDGVWLSVDPTNNIWIHSSLATLSIDITALPVMPTATPTPSSTPIPTSTLRPSITPIPAISLNTIYNNYQSMTTFKFNEYKNRIIGKPIRETVEVANVDKNGNINLSGPWDPFIFNIWDFCAIVNKVPSEKALSLDGGDHFYLDGTIMGIIGDYNYFFNCKTAIIIKYNK